jgi:hypothetical protein
LIGKTVPRTGTKGNKALNWWKVCENVHMKDKVPADQQQEFNKNKVGKCNLDFTNMIDDDDDRAEPIMLLMIHKQQEKRTHFQSLLIYLWPGNWQE